MTLKIFLPFRLLADVSGVSRIVAETSDGSLGFWPHRLDCVTALVPGILTYEVDGQGEVYVAVDQGVLVKAGSDVLVSVRRALAGADLGQLREQVTREFLTLDERERGVHQVMDKLESGFLRRFAELQHD